MMPNKKIASRQICLKAIESATAEGNNLKFI